MNKRTQVFFKMKIIIQCTFSHALFTDADLEKNSFGIWLQTIILYHFILQQGTTITENDFVIIRLASSICKKGNKKKFLGSTSAEIKQGWRYLQPHFFHAGRNPIGDVLKVLLISAPAFVKAMAGVNLHNNGNISLKEDTGHLVVYQASSGYLNCTINIFFIISFA